MKRIVVKDGEMEMNQRKEKDKVTKKQRGM